MVDPARKLPVEAAAETQVEVEAEAEVGTKRDEREVEVEILHKKIGKRIKLCLKDRQLESASMPTFYQVHIP